MPMYPPTHSHVHTHVLSHAHTHTHAYMHTYMIHLNYRDILLYKMASWELHYPGISHLSTTVFLFWPPGFKPSPKKAVDGPGHVTGIQLTPTELTWKFTEDGGIKSFPEYVNHWSEGTESLPPPPQSSESHASHKVSFWGRQWGSWSPANKHS